MAKSTGCACGAILEGATGTELLSAVERHLEAAHPELGWAVGRDAVGALAVRVSALERRVRTIEQPRVGMTA